MKFLSPVALALLVCALACGTPGAPRPLSLDLPRPVSDLAAARQGNQVTLTWSAPRETTDRQGIRRPGPVLICRGVNVTAMVQCPQVAELSPGPVPPKIGKPEQRTYTDTLPLQIQQQNPTGFATYALESLNQHGRSAGLSNQVEVQLAPTLPPPSHVRAQVTAEGILLAWTGVSHQDEAPQLRHLYRIFRRGENAPAQAIADVLLSTDPHASFLDHSFDWQKTYFYRLAVVTVVNVAQPPVQVEGERSPEVKVFANDVFPPSTPTGLQAVASGVGQQPFVDLTWAPNTESDLAGYNVYRSEAGQQPVKINNELVKTPSYRDTAAAAGHEYTYTVSAVDLRNNESPRSAEASESLP
ncbi:MAG: fibronectin type III domain-containing protein [Terriglobales bacterium]